MAATSAANGRSGDAKRKELGGYELLNEVGRGAMGAVFKARQRSMNRIVALKVLPQRLAKNAEFVARFLREAQSAARLNHVNIVQAFDAGQAGGYYYLSMEFVEGPCLDKLLRTSGALSEQRALEIVRDIARALEAAHGAGLIHRDVKPANILLTPQGEAKLADLGLARESVAKGGGELTNIGVALGTPDYMAPEQVRGEGDIDGRCDIYSLGATLYHLLTGQPAFKGGTRAEIMAMHLRDPMPDPRDLRAQVSPAAAAIVKRATEKERSGRYATASAMLADIEAAIASKRVSVASAGHTTAVTSRSRTRPRARRQGSKTWLTIGGAVAAVVVIGLFIALSGGPDNGAGSGPGAAQLAAAQKAVQDQKLLAVLRKWAKEHPDEYATGMSRYGSSIKKMTTPAVKLQAEDDVRELRRKLGDAAQAAFAPLKERAAELAKTGDYDGAIASFDKLPAQFAPVLAGSVKKAKGQLQTEADAKIEVVVAEARKLGADEKYDNALARLKQLGGLRYAAGQPKISAVRAELIADRGGQAEAARQRARDEASGKVGELLGAIDAAAKSNPAKAKELANAALKDDALKPAGAELTAAARVGTLVADLDERRRAALAASLKKLMGRPVVLETKHGKKGGRVKSVSGREAVLEKSFTIGGVVHKQPDEVVPFADLTGEMLKKYGTAPEPNTPNGAIAAAILAMASENWERMKSALAGAPGHPLHGRYAEKLDALAPAPPEQVTLWNKQRAVTITGYKSDLKNHQVKLVVDRDGDMKPNFADLRFADQAKNPLSYWFEKRTKTQATVWVKVPSIPKAGATITMKYGNPEAKSRSNGSATFVFFDDFARRFNTARWKRNRSGAANSCGAFVRRGILYIVGGDHNATTANGGVGWVISKATLPNKLIVESRMNLKRITDKASGRMALIQARYNLDRNGWCHKDSLVGIIYRYRIRHTMHAQTYFVIGLNQENHVVLERFWGNMWFRQSLYYDGTVSKGNVLYVRSTSRETETKEHFAAAEPGRLRLQFRPAGWMKGPNHCFLIDWIAVRSYARPDVTATIGAEADEGSEE